MTSSMSLAIAMLRNLYQNVSPPVSPLPLQQAQPLPWRANLHATIQAALDLISEELDLDLDEDSEENLSEESRQR